MSNTCPTCSGTGKVQTVQRRADKTPRWQLWEKPLYVTSEKGKRFVFQTEYAFVSPDGIVANYRISVPMGNLPTRMAYIDEFVCLLDLTGQTLAYIRQFEGWRKSSRKVSQENLARHYLVGDLLPDY